MDTFSFHTVVRGSFEDCLISFFNGDTVNNGRIMTVNDLCVRERAWFNGTLGPLSVIRTTAQNGGVAVPVVKRDLSAANLPSQLALAVGPVVAVSGSVIRSLVPLPQTLGAGVVTGLNYRGGGRLTGRKGAGLASFLDSGQGDANVQKFAIREGEGLAITTPTDFVTNNVYPFGWMLSGLVRDTTSGRSYSFCEIVYPESGLAMFGVFNGSGSGATYEVLMELHDLGTPAGVTLGTDVPYLRFMRTSGDNGGGTVLTLLPHSNDYVLSTKLTARVQNNIGLPLKYIQTTIPDGLDAAVALGYPVTNAPVYRSIGSVGHRLMQQGVVALSNAQGQPFPSYLVGKLKGRCLTRSFQGRVDLRGGDGFAIVNGGFDAMCVYEVSGQVLQSQPSAGYSRSRVVNR